MTIETIANLFNLPENYYGWVLFVLFVFTMISYTIGFIKKKITLIFLATAIFFIMALLEFTILFAIISALVFWGFASYMFICCNMYMKFSKFAFWSGVIATVIFFGLYLLDPSLLLGDN